MAFMAGVFHDFHLIIIKVIMILVFHSKDYFQQYLFAFPSMKYSFLQFSLLLTIMDSFKCQHFDLKLVNHWQCWFSFHFYWLL
jgi:hypothetical protein